MLKKKIIKKDHLKPFLRKLSKGSDLIAPVRNGLGDVLYEKIHSIDHQEIDLSTQPQESAKAFLFPQSEALYTYDCSQGYRFSQEKDGRPTVLFGLRSCDISAILYMDVIFMRGPKDLHYVRRREKTIIIGIGCNKPWENCFCNATKSGPFLEFGFDLQLTDLGDRYFVESGRARGDSLIDNWPQFFLPVTEEDERLRYQLVLEARSGFTRQVHVDSAFNRIKDVGVDASIWEHLATRCDGCGGCAYICPTCTCFTIFDRPTSRDKGQRIRTWDSCTHLGFTEMAGGANPVNPQRDRLKRRFLHKLYYDYLEFKRPSCVGCGRCLGICFGGVDIGLFVELVCSNSKKGREEDSANILAKLLVEAGLVDQEEIEEALAQRAKTGTPLGKILVEKGLVTKGQLAEVLMEKVEKS
ncbi:MAG: 4Fe-4S ferredoxin [Thermodesulfobacteria bacterium]|nr:4Fe-4S ferredoxin [Thermodesulfobacteriota bacterium]